MENCVRHEGAVERISDGPSGDIIIQLKNDNTSYYINRGVESGLKITQLNVMLLNKQVELLTIKNPNPLGGRAISKHIAQVKLDHKLIYSEL